MIEEQKYAYIHIVNRIQTSIFLIMTIFFFFLKKNDKRIIFLGQILLDRIK
jgi:hypothetical protein